MARLTEAELIEKYERLSSYENEYFSRGFTRIAGIDEAGRGAGRSRRRRRVRA